MCTYTYIELNSTHYICEHMYLDFFHICVSYRRIRVSWPSSAAGPVPKARAKSKAKAKAKASALQGVSQVEPQTAEELKSSLSN